jgi:hypothetical protein
MLPLIGGSQCLPFSVFRPASVIRSVATSNFGTGLAPDSRPAMRSSLLLLCSQSLTNFNRAFNHGGYILCA